MLLSDIIKFASPVEKTPLVQAIKQRNKDIADAGEFFTSPPPPAASPNIPRPKKVLPAPAPVKSVAAEKELTPPTPPPPVDPGLAEPAAQPQTSSVQKEINTAAQSVANLYAQMRSTGQRPALAAVSAAEQQWNRLLSLRPDLTKNENALKYMEALSALRSMAR